MGVTALQIGVEFFHSFPRSFTLQVGSIILPQTKGKIFPVNPTLFRTSGGEHNTLPKPRVKLDALLAVGVGVHRRRWHDRMCWDRMPGMCGCEYMCVCVCVCVYVCVCVIIHMVALREEQLVNTTGSCNGKHCFSPRSVSFVFVLYTYFFGMFTLVTVCC
jgi:hypothetical protein